MRVAAVLGVVLGAALLVAAGIGLTYDGRRDVDLVRWVGTEDAWTQSRMPGARIATDELCGAELPCVQALTSETLTMYRFADRDQARAAASSFGPDGHVTGWIAVRYVPGALSPAERADVEYGIGCIGTWRTEDGRDC